MVLTKGGRPAYVVNVEAYLYQGDRWLLIERGPQEAHAPGRLSAPGGKVEADGADAIPGILEQTAVREALEEVGVDLNAVTLSYVESAFFVTDDGDPVVNVAFTGELPDQARPYAASAEEVARVRMMTVAQVLADSACPPWTRRALTRAELLRTARKDDVRSARS